MFVLLGMTVCRRGSGKRERSLNGLVYICVLSVCRQAGEDSDVCSFPAMKQNVLAQEHLIHLPDCCFVL